MINATTLKMPFNIWFVVVCASYKFENVCFPGIKSGKSRKIEQSKRNWESERERLTKKRVEYVNDTHRYHMHVWKESTVISCFGEMKFDAPYTPDRDKQINSTYEARNSILSFRIIRTFRKCGTKWKLSLLHIHILGKDVDICIVRSNSKPKRERFTLAIWWIMITLRST